MTEETYIGIDPGLSGAVAIIDSQAKLTTLAPTPTVKIGKKKYYDIQAMKEILQTVNHLNPIICLEKVHAMPGQGVTSMFRFGEGYGIWLGLVNGLGIPYMEVHPRTWTKKMLRGIAGIGKERSYLKARQLWPEWKPKFKYEHEYSDALLLAEYGRLER